MPVVLGLDSSLTKMGYCLLDAGPEAKFYNIGKWYTSNLGNIRLSEIAPALRSIVDSNDVVLVGVEEYAYNAWGQVYNIGEAGGIVKLWFYKKQIPMVRVQSRALKKFATANGSATKTEIIQSLNSRYNIGLKDGTHPIPGNKRGKLEECEDDKGDAVTLALIVRMWYRVWMGLDSFDSYSAHEREVYDRLLLAKEWFL